MVPDRWQPPVGDWWQRLGASIEAAPRLANPSNWGVRSPLESLIDAVSSTLLNRRITTSIGDKPLAFTLESVSTKLDPLGSTMGQADQVSIDAADIDYDGLHVARARATLHNVHTRVGINPTLVAAPVDVTFVGDWPQVDELVHRYTGAFTLNSTDARTATVASAHRPRWGSVNVEVVAEQGRLKIRPVRVSWRGRSLSITQRLPAVPIPTNLGSNARLREVTVEDDGVHVVVRFDQWRAEYTRLWSFIR